jgi:GAF domain-containing protein
MESQDNSPGQSGAPALGRGLRKSSGEEDDIARLHEFTTRLFTTTDLQPVLDEVLDASISLPGADLGNVGLYDPQSHSLKIVAQRGFEQDFLDCFNAVRDGTANCGAASTRRKRVIVEDLLAEPAFRTHAEIVAAAGYRAVPSTPLLSRTAGVISTHFAQPHRLRAAISACSISTPFKPPR